jgi:hypothetical protein
VWSAVFKSPSEFTRQNKPREVVAYRMSNLAFDSSASSTTAELLRKEGKSKWITPRSEKISVKGKGMMQTSWLRLKKPISNLKDAMASADSNIVVFDLEGESNNGEASENSDCPDDYNNELPEMKNQLSKVQRLIEWNTEVLSKLLQQIVASRPDKPPMDLNHLEKEMGKDNIALDEFREIVSLPKVGPDEMKHRRDPSEVLLPLHVVAQLRNYITKISQMYLDNPFHNFEVSSFLSFHSCCHNRSQSPLYPLQPSTHVMSQPVSERC